MLFGHFSMRAASSGACHPQASFGSSIRRRLRAYLAKLHLDTIGRSLDSVTGHGGVVEVSRPFLNLLGVGIDQQMER